MACAATIGRVRSKAPSAAELRRCTAAAVPPSSAMETGGGEPRSASRPLAIRSARRSSPPRSWSAGTRQSSKTISPVCEARQPSLSSLRSRVSPGVPLGTMKTPWPRWPASGSTVATTTWTSAMPPLPMKTFCPSMTQSSPSLRARVWIERTSLPPLGSVTASAASFRSSGRAEALRRPAHELLVGRGLADRGQRQRRHDDRQADARAAPEELLHEDRQRQSGGSTESWA